MEEKVLWILKKSTTSQFKKCLSIFLLQLFLQIQKGGVVYTFLSFPH